MQNTRYWVCAHVPLQNGKHFPKNEPFAWKGAGYVPGVTGNPTASVLVALIDAPSSIDARAAIFERFGRDVHFVFMSPKPEGWAPPGFKMAH